MPVSPSMLQGIKKTSSKARLACDNDPMRVLVAGGHTGGHIQRALAISPALETRAVLS